MEGQDWHGRPRLTFFKGRGWRENERKRENSVPTLSSSTPHRGQVGNMFEHCTFLTRLWVELKLKINPYRRYTIVNTGYHWWNLNSIFTLRSLAISRPKTCTAMLFAIQVRFMPCKNMMCSGWQKSILRSDDFIDNSSSNADLASWKFCCAACSRSGALISDASANSAKSSYLNHAGLNRFPNILNRWLNRVDSSSNRGTGGRKWPVLLRPRMAR